MKFRTIIATKFSSLKKKILYTPIDDEKYTKCM